MPVIYAKAPGKIILFGEHAVVYGYPAIAIPVKKVNATARVFPNLEGQPGEVRIQAPDIHLDTRLSDLPGDDPLAVAIQRTLESVLTTQTPSFTVLISSTIPISAGMGSSAAIAIATIKAISYFLGKPLPTEQVSNLALQVEQIHHGTPSGIDNTVIAYQTPIFFIHGEPIEIISIETPTHWVIADSGEKTPTRETVSDVRTQYDADPDTVIPIFNQIGEISSRARDALISGDISRLGELMNSNQDLLQQLGVSSQRLEALITAAKNAGAAGAKLSGGGRGGNIIALAPSDETQEIETALLNAGAQRIITTTLYTGEIE
jgi:mevalonate kinase